MASVETPESPNGPWRILVLDRNPDDPLWMILTVVVPTDVGPAALDPAGRYRDWRQVCEWVREQTGFPVSLIPVQDALAWTIDNRTS
jgi:hypothetical protein